MTGNFPLVVVLGPTAVGKTGFAIEMAKAINGEIVSADSRQIYRYMDTGTAKPTVQQRREIPHHLIDIVNPDENLSLAQYQRLAYETIDSIHERGKLPLFVGGTGQYITAVIEGWSIPEVAPNPALRAELEAFASKHGAEALHQRLRELDPAAADKIDFRNLRRVVRALEICLETGEPMDYEARRQPPNYRVYSLGLTLEREALYERADQRVDAMVVEGFLDEVRGLLAMGYSSRLPSMSGLGYRELSLHLEGKLALEAAVNNTKHATHDFIRRQYTWFRGHEHGTVWVNVEHETATILQDVQVWLERISI